MVAFITAHGGDEDRGGHVHGLVTIRESTTHLRAFNNGHDAPLDL
jgi:hypothetical protein